jgi:hypothetical protein
MAFLKKNNNPVTPSGNPVNNMGGNMMQQWNSYVDWLDSKGMKGSPELDKGDKGFQMMEEYRKINPSFTIKKDDIGTIQKQLQDYRNFSLDSIKQGKMKISYGGKEMSYNELTPAQQKDVDDNYMGKIAKTAVDKFPGQFTTSTKFSSEFISKVNSREVAGRVGFNPLSPTETADIVSKTAEVQGAVKAGPKFSLKKK